MTTTDIAGQFLPFNIKNSAVPPEGPKAVRIPLNFSLATSLLADLTMLVQGQPNPQMSYVQTLFIDNSINGQSLSIITDALVQTVVIPPFSQAYVPILQPNFPKIIFQSSGAVLCEAFALNFPVAPAVWSVGNAFGGASFAGGSLKVTDVILDALVANYNTYGNALAVADLGLQTALAGNSIRVTGAGGGSVANLFSFHSGFSFSNVTLVTGTAGKSIIVNSVKAIGYGSGGHNTIYGPSAGTLTMYLQDGGAGNVFEFTRTNFPAADSAAPLSVVVMDWTGLDYECAVGGNLTVQVVSDPLSSGQWDVSVTYSLA